ncbi:MAG: type sorting protein [Bacteroidota bacterium]|jgi:hypothetical protein|nr:type sorting protein [Bacteroidota bacterium]
MKRLVILLAVLFLISSACVGNTIGIENLTVTGSKSEVSLSWNCKVAEKGHFFIVERSSDALTYNFIDTIYSVAFLEQYACKDKNPINGISYYRIRCLTLSGNEVSSMISYIELSEVEISETFRIAGLYPLPFADRFNIVIESKRDVTLTFRCNNLDGTLVFELSKAFPKGVTTFNISDFTKLENDSYLLTVSDEHLYSNTRHLIRFD